MFRVSGLDFLELTYKGRLHIIVSTMQEDAKVSTEVALHRSRTVPAIAYRVRPGTSQEGEPVILLHGVGSSSATWAELVPYLDERHTLVMPDYRGHGDSDDPEPPYRVADFVDDLFRLLDELGIQRAHLVGFSIGAIFAQAAATARPERIASLVLLNSIADRTEAERARAAERSAFIRDSEPAAIAESSVERWFTPRFARERPDVVADEVAIVSANRSRPYAAAYDVLATTDLIESAGEIACPVLLITGENDRGSTPRMSRALQSRIPGSELVVVDGRQHYLHREVPALIADLINGFLGSRTTGTIHNQKEI